MKFRAILELEVEPHGQTAEEIKWRIQNMIAAGFILRNRITVENPAEILPGKLDVIQKRARKRSPKFIAAKQTQLPL